MLTTSEKKSTRRLFGLMALVLGIGDAFHLVPRIYALLTTGVENHVVPLGIGKFITSITMTGFYVILYYVWRHYYKITNRKNVTTTIWILALLRVGTCLLPQNQWLSATPPLLFSILRNIPFTMMGIILIILFYQQNKTVENSPFQHMPLAIILSFGFYIPVVLFGNVNPMIGLLMIPKTLAYVWVVMMGYKLPKTN